MIMVLSFNLSACSKKTNRVLVTSYPIEYLVTRIGGDSIDVINISDGNIIQRAAINKNYKKELKDSDLLFYINGLEPYFDIYSDEMKKSKIKMIDLAYKSKQYKFQRNQIDYRSNNLYVTSGSYYTSNEFDQVNMYKTDPMVWMDVSAFIGVAENIMKYLKDTYPENKDLYEQNFEKVKADLALLDSNYQLLKKSENKLKIATMTPSFGNWQNAYGVDVYPICLSKYGVLPTDKQLAIIENELIKNNVKYIVYEPNMPNDMKKLYKKVKTDLNLKTIELSNLALLSKDQKDNNQDYLTLMYDNLKALEKVVETDGNYSN